MTATTDTRDKKALRAHYTALRDSLSREERCRAEERILRRLFSLPAWQEAPLVCGYVSTRGELDTDPMWVRAAAEGKRYALPVTVTGSREGRMVFRAVDGYRPDRLVTARFGISEPDETCPTLSLPDYRGSLILVPGLAFDGAGYRLGYGGGYYDRFLAALRDARIPVTTVGLVYATCRAPYLPREAYDIPADLVIDERSAPTL